MTTEKKLQIIIERNIPLDPTCEIKRKIQIDQRVKLRIEIEELLREVKPFDPRTQLK